MKCHTEETVEETVGETVELVNNLILSQEDTLQTQRMVREISRETGFMKLPR